MNQREAFAETIVLERRKVEAMERIAASLELLAGDLMTAPTRPMQTTPAAVTPKLEEKAPAVSGTEADDDESDEVEPMNGDD